MKGSGLKNWTIFSLVIMVAIGLAMAGYGGIAAGLGVSGKGQAFAQASFINSNAEVCRQIIVNPQLDVLEFGPGKGTAEPWFFLDPVIYFFEEGDGSGLAYDGYSLVLPDGDDGDPTPTSDILSQIVQFENYLNSVTIAYQRAMLDPNPADQVYGELWQLTSEGDVDLGNPQSYRLLRWTITDSQDNYAEEVIEVSADLLSELNGQEIALLLRTVTDGGGATEADEEWVLFDDVTMTICYQPAKIFLPVVRGN